MNSAAIRQQLHKYIDSTDDKKIEALYTLLQSDMGQYPYTQQELDILHERAEKYQAGTEKGYTVEESHELIRKNRKGNGL